MFNDLVVQPIFNLLVLIYALIPGHNFGLAIILFTICIRLLMWPLVKKQLHQAKAMRGLQPEIKRIKQTSKGNRQEESRMLMELYKERNISPFGSFGVLIIQLIILLGLYSGLNHVIHDPRAIVDNAYHWITQLGWMQTVAHDISKFDATLLGFIDLKRPAIGSQGLYIPALLLVVGSAAAQYFQSSQLLPQSKDKRSLRTILKEASQGKATDQADVSEALNRNMRFLIPGLVLITTIGLASALSLYWMVGGIVAYIQQSRVLNQDVDEMEIIADAPGDGTRIIIDGEVIKDTTNKKPETKTKKATSAKKRRKR
jgi:YidC/Oxa1 family membrane protein insertase